MLIVDCDPMIVCVPLSRASNKSLNWLRCLLFTTVARILEENRICYGYTFLIKCHLKYKVKYK